MSEIICHHNGKYNFYSTIADGFSYESSITLEQVEEAIEYRYGRRGIEALPARLSRAHKNGHSALHGGTLEDFLDCNRAGAGEAHLSFQECIARFLS